MAVEITTAKRVVLPDGRVVRWSAENGKLIEFVVTHKRWTYSDATRIVRDALLSEPNREIVANAFADYFSKAYPAFSRERFLRHVLGGHPSERLASKLEGEPPIGTGDLDARKRKVGHDDLDL